MEQGQVGVEALAAVVVETDLVVAAGFRLQVRAADGDGAALAGGAVDAVVQVVDAGGAVAAADAALHGPGIAGRPGQVHARAEVAAECIMVLVAAAEGQAYRIDDAPFVLDEDRPRAALEALGGDAVLHLRVDVLSAHAQRVAFAQRRHQAGVQDQVFRFQLARRAADDAGEVGPRQVDGAGDGAAGGFGALPGQRAFPQAEADRAAVGQNRLFAVEAQLVGIAGGAVVRRGAAGHGVAAPAIQGAELAVAVLVHLAALLDIQRHLVQLVGGQGQACAPVGVASFHGGSAAAADHRAVIEAQVRSAALADAAANGQAQAVGGQRAGHVHVGAGGGAVAGVFLEGVVQAHRAHPGVGHAAGDDVDHAADGVRPVQGRHRSADHLDALDRRQRRHEAVGGFAKPVRGDVATVVLAAAVHQHQGVGAGHAADADVQAAGLAGALVDVHAFHVAKGLGQVGVLLALKLLAADHADACRRVGDLLLEARGGHHHGVEIDRIACAGVSRDRGGEGQGNGEGKQVAPRGRNQAGGTWGHQTAPGS